MTSPLSINQGPPVATLPASESSALPDRAAATTTPAAATTSHRFALVDALRGLAAVAVMAYHFVPADFAAPLARVFSHRVVTMLRAGWIGVPIFFVLSGFVITHSIGRHEMTARRALRFVVRRQVRLDPPYWVTIALLLGVRFAWHVAHPQWPYEMASPGAVLAHVLYVYDLMHIPTINAVVWSLAIEVHFYCFFVLLLVLTRRMPSARSWLVAATGMLSLYCAYTWRYPHAWFTQHWYLFATGAVTRWSLDERAPRWMGVGMAGIILALGLRITRLEFIVGGLVPLLFFVAGRRNALGRWMSARWLQFLGATSYGIYLLHNLAGSQLRAVSWVVVDSSTPLGATIVFFAEIAFTIFCAWVLNRTVEQWAMKQAARIRWADDSTRAAASPSVVDMRNRD